MLDHSQRELLQHLFAEGAELVGAERAAFVQRACPEDPAVRAELAELLQIQGREEDRFLTEPAVPWSEDLVATVGMPGSNSGSPAVALPAIHGYADFERIAIGGMGEVFKAHQLHPVRRTVAVKVIRWGLDSESVMARFEIERQALAAMSHPYIAAVYDAGTDALGRPFIAMEFVEGLPITGFCQREGLSLSQRLHLFVKVCRAVEHAHRRGVLHRDLKPSNVLVCQQGGEAMPKVIDFGIAKALSDDLGERSLHTNPGTQLGTPEYMSPEQLEDSIFHVDTRSDVYSLGIMLYELVAGVHPFDCERLRRCGLLQLGRIIQHEVPPKPSTRLRDLVADADGSAPSARGDTVRWLKRLRGDLDWIVMRAIEKEPERRYNSPQDLAQDLEDFLANRPVAAGPPSGWYHLRKFVRRHRVQVAAAVLILLSLVAGLWAALWSLGEAQASARTAQERTADAESATREAEGIRLAAQAANLAEEDANLALLLAIEARQLTDDFTVNQTIHRVLPHCCQAAILDGHDHDTRQVIYLADGRLLSRAYDSVVLLWDADAGEVLRRFAGHGSVVNHMDLDHAGGRLLTVAMDGEVRVWDVATGECLQRVQHGTAGLPAACWAPDGRSFVTASADGTARVHRLGDAEPRLELRGSDRALRAVAFAPAGERIATLGDDRVTRIWDSASGALQRELPPGAVDGAGAPGGVWFAPRGDRVVSLDRVTTGQTRLLLDAIDGERLLDLPDATMVRFLTGDRLLFSRVEGWGEVLLQSGQVIESPRRTVCQILGATEDGRLGVAVDARQDLCLVDLVNDVVVRRLSGHSDKRRSFLGVDFHPDGSRVAVTGSMLRVWHLKPPFAPLDVPGRNLSVVPPGVAGNGMVLFEDRDGGVQRSVWSILERRRVALVPPLPVDRLSLSPCGTMLLGAVTDAATGPDAPARLAVFDLQGRLLREIDAEPPLFGWVVGPGGREVLVSVGDRRLLRVHDLHTGALLRQIPDPKRLLHWSPAGDRLMASYGSQRRTDVFDSHTGALVARIAWPRSGHHMAAIDPTGRYLLIPHYDRLASVWDLTADLAVPDPVPLTTYVDLVRSDAMLGGFARGGELAWVMCANEVHIFETVGGRTFSVLRLDEGCAAVAASADGEELFTVTRSGRCQRWPLRPVALARRLAIGELGQRDLVQYRIGTAAEREARERRQLERHPTPLRLARLGDLAAAAGDLDEAIACYQRAVALGPLAAHDADVYVVLLDLLCRRLQGAGRTAEQRDGDQATAVVAVREALRCGVTRQAILALPAIDAVAGNAALQRALAR